jgi:RHS repeat-associated protein
LNATTIYPVSTKNLGHDKCPCDFVGNPINVATGNKFQQETDFAISKWITFSRYYNSDPAVTSTHIGSHWRHTFDRSLTFDMTNSYVAVNHDDGGVDYFTNSGNDVWTSDVDISDTLVPKRDNAGTLISWQYFVSATRQIESYSPSGSLISIQDQTGLTEAFQYSDASTPSDIAPYAGLLITITDPFGRNVNLTYYPDGNVSTASDPAGNLYSYSYDAAGNLKSVTYPDQKQRTYLYNEPQYVAKAGGIPWALTGIQDENQARYATYTYDNTGAAQSTQHGNGVEQWTFVGGLHNPLGLLVSHIPNEVNNVYKLGTVDERCPTCAFNDGTRTNTYDAAGYLQQIKDGNGNITKFTYDDINGLELTKVEAFGSSDQRTTQTDWDTTLREPLERRLRDNGDNLVTKTNWKYNDRGQVLARCEVDPAVVAALSYTCGSLENAPTGVRQWSYLYCEPSDVSANSCPKVGLLKQVDGPRTDVSDLTSYSYYQTTDVTGCSTLGEACHYVGDLQSVTNALGQITQYLSYDKNGRVTRVEDANGILTDTTYSPRGWMLSRAVGGGACYRGCGQMAATEFEYDNVGNLKKVTQPDGDFLIYGYDTAHRLTDITDNFGNNIHYVLDNANDRLNESIYDPAGLLRYSLSHDYNQMGWLRSTRNAQNEVMQSDGYQGSGTFDEYDANGNQTYSLDGNGLWAYKKFDGLNRVTEASTYTCDSYSCTFWSDVYHQYDSRDNTIEVTDSDNLKTQYIYDGLNNLSDLYSPDTGHTHYTYDDAGNRVTKTDANGNTATYSFDALNRVSSITYSDGPAGTSYAYDEPNATTGCVVSYPVGRLTTMTDSSGNTKYCYDRRGNVLVKTQVADNGTFTTSYAYTLGDRVSTVTYPGGDSISYGRDIGGRVTSVDYAPVGKNAINLVSDVSYSPFGPVNKLTFGNGRSLTKSYDQNYAIDTIFSSDANGLFIKSQFDVLGNLTNASDSPDANPSTRSYYYDALYRIKQVRDSSSVVLENYTYNDTGDRLSKTYQGQTSSYGYGSPLTSHRLQTVNGVIRDYDANGNTTAPSDGQLPAFTFDGRNRMSYVHLSSTPPVCVGRICSWGSDSAASYDYNGLGQRTLKFLSYSGYMVHVDETAYVYGEQGKLIGQYPIRGNVAQAEYIYLDNTPVAYVTNSTVYYIETDQLGTPRTVIQPGTTTATDSVVWKWDYFGSAFGENAPNQDPNNTGTDFTFNLRFPGQYFDAETGMHYNYFRDYEPGTGRYVESDPVGLNGGINTYAYAASTPLISVDPSGETHWEGNLIYGEGSLGPPSRWTGRWGKAFTLVSHARVNLTLHTKCKCHKQIWANIEASSWSGPGFYDGPNTAIKGKVSIDDNSDTPNPANLFGPLTLDSGTGFLGVSGSITAGSGTGTFTAEGIKVLPSAIHFQGEGANVGFSGQEVLCDEDE